MEEHKLDFAAALQTPGVLQNLDNDGGGGITPVSYTQQTLPTTSRV